MKNFYHFSIDRYLSLDNSRPISVAVLSTSHIRKNF